MITRTFFIITLMVGGIVWWLFTYIFVQVFNKIQAKFLKPALVRINTRTGVNNSSFLG